MQHADNVIYTLVVCLYMLRCEIKVTYLITYFSYLLTYLLY